MNIDIIAAILFAFVIGGASRHFFPKASLCLAGVATLVVCALSLI